LIAEALHTGQLDEVVLLMPIDECPSVQFLQPDGALVVNHRRPAGVCRCLWAAWQYSSVIELTNGLSVWKVKMAGVPFCSRVLCIYKAEGAAVASAGPERQTR